MSFLLKVIVVSVLVVWRLPVITSKKVIDVAFFVDASGSVGARGFEKQLQAVVKMARVFGVSYLGSHASVVLHSTDSRRVISFDDFYTLKDIERRIYSAPFLRGHTRMDLALKFAIEKVFTAAGNAREYVPKIAILFIDGRQSSNGKDRLAMYNEQLRQLGVTLYIMGIGTHISKYDLEQMVTNRDHVFYIYNFKALRDQGSELAKKVYAMTEEIYNHTEDGKFKCTNPIDLGFVVQSKGLGVRRFRRMKQYISGIASIVGVDGVRSNAGLVLYNGRDNSVQIKFKDVTKNTFSNLLLNITENPGENDIAKALQTANTQLFTSQSRSTVSRIAVLLISGKRSKGSLLPRLIASQLKAREIKVMVIGIGTDLDYTELSEVASEASFFVPVRSIRFLGKSIMPLARKICAESVPTARGFYALGKSHEEISVKWYKPWDPSNVITGYDLSWKLVENEKRKNVINAPLESKELPADAQSYSIKDLSPFSLYNVQLAPLWRDSIRGDMPEVRVRTLADENECLSKPCDVNAECTNTPRSFHCTCNDGYSGDGLTCTDDNECEANVCDVNAVCTNTPGSFKCACKTGFSGGGFSCIDDNECDDVDRCDENAECENTPGSYTCECNQGYSGDGKTCKDDNECVRDKPCSNDATCTNTPGSFQCKCNIGYSGDGKNCQDIDECVRDKPCSNDATCTNSPGSFQCKCNIGYSGNGFTCQDVNECEQFDPCDNNAVCTNTLGTYTCRCRPGYSGNGFTCTDVDECKDEPCDLNAKCTNTQGSHQCKCKLGYAGDGVKCTDINECGLSESPCDVNAECFNTDGSFYCECNIGYNGNGRVCTAVNICSYPMDLAIAIDTSDSINTRDFETQKEAIIMLARSFGLSRLGSHVAVIVYGSEANVVIKLGEHTQLEDFSKAVRQIKYSGGSTRIDKALSLASTQVFSSKEARSGMPKMLIIMTDGQQTSAPDSTPLKLAVAPLKSSGVKIITVAIGKEVDEFELMAISESASNIHHVLSFETLFDTITKVGQSLCAKAKRECRSHADIAILVDSSASMRGGNYLKEKSLIKAIAREFDVSLHGSHVSLVLYNTESEVILGFNNRTTLKKFEMTVDRLPLKGGKIRLDKALRLTASDVFVKEKGMREDQPKIMFILTDGTQNRKCEEEALELAIAPLRSEGIHAVAIGVGEADVSELRPLVKSTNDLFTGDDFDEVTEPVMKFIKGFCQNNDQSCTVGSQFIDIKVGGCASEKSVEVGVCDGKCSSGTRYLSEPPFYESRCTCCLPRIDSSKEVSLKCADGTTMLYRINEASACECRSCGGVVNAPAIPNKGTSSPP